MATRTYTTRDLEPEDAPIAAAEPRKGAISVRALALGGALAGGVAIAGAIADAIAVGSTDVSEDIWSYPWSGATFVATTLVFALLHVLLFGLLLGLRRSGLTGPTRAASVGLGVAMAGTVLVFLAELAGIPARDYDVDSTTVTAVIIPMFALGGLAAAFGLIVAGRATLRAQRWDGWGRFTPLGLGVAALLPTVLGSTDLFPYGFALYGVALLALGAALATGVSDHGGRAGPRRQG